MKIKQISLTVAAILVTGVVSAATINVNGTEATGTLGSLSVDSSGNVAITSSGAMTYAGGTGSTPGGSNGSSYTVGGSVTGLPANTSVTLKNNALDTVTISSDGAFTFPTALGYSSAYNITVSSQPTGASCTVASGTGTVNNSNVTNVAVSCSSSTPPAAGSCGVTPSNVTIGVPVRGKFYDLGSGTTSFPFTVLAGYNNYSAGYSSVNPTQKIVWISTCPGAADANGVPAPVGSRFYIQGYQDASLLVSGASTTNVANKQLTVGDTYYFNVRNATTAAPTVTSCPSGNCPFVLGVPN